MKIVNSNEMQLNEVSEYLLEIDNHGFRKEEQNRYENLSSDVQKGIIGCMEISKLCIPLGIQVQPYT